MASLHLLPPLYKFCSSLAPLSNQHAHHFPSPSSLNCTTSIKPLLSKSFAVRFALTESDSPKSLEPDPQALLQEIAVSFHFCLLPISIYDSESGFQLKLSISCSICAILMRVYVAGQFWSSFRLLCTASTRSSIRCKWNMYFRLCSL